MIAMLDERRMQNAAAEEISTALNCARAAQPAWGARRTSDRAALIGKLRPLLAHDATEIAQITAAVSERPIAEKMVSEVLPLLEACRFLEKNAARLLRSKRFGAKGRPLWLHGSSFEVQRKPFGVVLIVAPANYPLFIPAVQTLHALAAGNAVLVKPAEGASAPMAAFIDRLLARAGIPADLVHLLPESPEAARAAAYLGVDKVVFTGSSKNGRSFLADLAETNTPSVMELSGADVVYVRGDADVELAAKAIAFGLRLNGGNTCMAPHSIVVQESVTRQLLEALSRHDFLPGSVFRVRDDREALELTSLDEHGLGAAVFSRDTVTARVFADQLPTGFVTINDMIVPTADPRFPFGGTRGSGFGVTRGAEGLLEMTYPKTVAIRRGRIHPHLEKPVTDDAEMFAAFICALHGRGLLYRLAALAKLIRHGRARLRKQGDRK